MTEQPTTLQLAEISPYLEHSERSSWNMAVCAELRRLHEVNQELLKPLLAWEKAYCDKDFSLTMRQFDLMVRAAIAKATGATT